MKRDEKIKIAIVGSGNGAMTVAVDMVDRDCDVRLYCRNGSTNKFDATLEKGGFDFNNEGGERFVEFTNISGNTEYVSDGADIVQAIIPSSLIEYYAKVILEFVTNSHLAFFSIAASMGSIRFMNVLEDHHTDVHPHFVETDTLTYGTRVDFDNAKIDLSLSVRRVFFSAFNRSELNKSYERVSKIYNHPVKEESSLRTNLENDNPEVHSGPTLLNVGRTDYPEEFSLYEEGITRHTVKLLRAIEIERLNLGRKLGSELPTAKESRIQRGYLERKDEDEPLNRLFNTSPALSQVSGPNHIENRYLAEDTAYGLVLWSSLGRAVDAPTLNIDVVIMIASTILERSSFEEGLTIEELGLGKLGLE